MLVQTVPLQGHLCDLGMVPPLLLISLIKESRLNELMKASFTYEIAPLLWMSHVLMANQTGVPSMVDMMLSVSKEIQCVEGPHCCPSPHSRDGKHTCAICLCVCYGTCRTMVSLFITDIWSTVEETEVLKVRAFKKRYGKRSRGTKLATMDGAHTAALHRACQGSQRTAPVSRHGAKRGVSALLFRVRWRLQAWHLCGCEFFTSYLN